MIDVRWNAGSRLFARQVRPGTARRKTRVNALMLGRNDNRGYGNMVGQR